jgi:hypothetical protein
MHAKHRGHIMSNQSLRFIHGQMTRREEGHALETRKVRGHIQDGMAVNSADDGI